MKNPKISLASADKLARDWAEADECAGWKMAAVLLRNALQGKERESEGVTISNGMIEIDASKWGTEVCWRIALYSVSEEVTE